MDRMYPHAPRQIQVHGCVCQTDNSLFTKVHLETTYECPVFPASPMIQRYHV